MKLPNHVQSSGMRFNMTPMIDVVFLLIIFFLVSSHLARQETQVELALPAATSGDDVWDDSTPRVTLNVLADGSFLFGGRPLLMADLESRLGAAIGSLGEQTELRIRADREVPYRNVSPILSAASRSGIWRVTFAVIRPEDVR